MPNAYTFQVVDTNNLISAAQEAQITACAQYVIGLVSRYIDWQGTMDFVVDIKPHSASPYPEINGILPTISQIAPNGSGGWTNQTLNECITGVDANPSAFDAGCTIYLGQDGAIRNYGAPVWFDPNPQFDTNAAVPASQHDFIGIYTHEIFHALGFYQVTEQWQDQISTHDGQTWFEGENVADLYGGDLPFGIGSDHYGTAQNPIGRGLMYQFGNYEGNRLDIGRIDLAVLEDLGHTIKSYDGLSLFELIDTQLNLTGTAGFDALYGDYHDNILSGLGGNDNIEGGAGNDRLDGGTGFDAMAGGAGNDTYIVDNGGDTVNDDAGQGFDTVYTSIDFAISFYAEIEVLLAVDATATTPLVLAGNQYANTITGNAGDNLLNGSLGADILSGLGGNDIYLLDNAGDVVIEGANGGFDTGYVYASYTVAAGLQLEVVSAYNWYGFEAYNFTGNELDNRLYGNGGFNQFVGGLGNDMIIGFGGGDTMNGGAGNDDYYTFAANDVIDETAGGGRDSVFSYTSFTLAADDDIEVLSTYSFGGTEAYNLTGNALAQLVYGNAGVNTLNGHLGADYLHGFGGADTFAFTTALGAGNIDTVGDFVAGTDKIGLDDAIFTGLALGALNANAFFSGAGATAHDADDRIVYDSATGALFFDADGIGGAGQVQFATLSTGLVLAASDFQVI